MLNTYLEDFTLFVVEILGTVLNKRGGEAEAEPEQPDTRSTRTILENY